MPLQSTFSTPELLRHPKKWVPDDMWAGKKCTYAALNQFDNWASNFAMRDKEREMVWTTQLVGFLWTKGQRHDWTAGSLRLEMFGERNSETVGKYGNQAETLTMPKRARAGI